MDLRMDAGSGEEVCGGLTSSEGTVGGSDDEGDWSSVEESAEAEEGSSEEEPRETLEEAVSVEHDAVEASSGGMISGEDDGAEVSAEEDEAGRADNKRRGST